MNPLLRSNSVDSTHSQRSRVASYGSVHSIEPIAEQTLKNENEPLPPVKRKMINNKRELIIFLSMGFLLMFGQAAVSVIAPFFSLEAKKKEVNVTLTGLIFAIFPLVVFILSPFVGKFMPVIGVKFMLIAGTFLEGGTEILFGFVTEIEHRQLFIVFCFLIRAVTAIGNSASSTSSISILTYTFPDNVATVFGALELFSGLGFMIGPSLGGVLYRYGGFKLPFIVLGACLLAVLLIVVFVLPPESSFHDNNTLSDEEPRTGSLTKTISVPGIFVMGVVCVVSAMVLSFFDPGISLHLEDVTHNGLSGEKIGLIFMIPSIFYGITAPIVGMLSEKILNRRHVMIFGAILSGASYFVMGPSPLVQSFIPVNIYVVCVGFGLLGLGISPLVVPILSDMHNAAKHAGLPEGMTTKSIISGIFNSGFSVGSVIGPTLGGFLTEKYSFDWSVTMFGFVLFGLALFLIIFTIWENNSKWSRKPISAGYQPIET